MCGTLKYFTDPSSSLKIGNPVPITLSHSGITSKAVWTGFCRSEKLAYWKTVGAGKPVVVHVDSFIEGKTECHVPSGKFFGIILGKDVIVSGKTIGRAGEIKIVTRAAHTPFEKKIHPRFPLSPRVDKKGFQIWENGEIKTP